MGKTTGVVLALVLFLSATPHSGKSDAFRRLMNLLDAEDFPLTIDLDRQRVAPYVIRTEKRKAIDVLKESGFKSIGLDQNRTSLLLAVLEKRVGLELLGDDVFVSVAGGLEVDEPAADLGVAAAVASSFRNRPLPANTVLFGEVGLGGEVRGAAQSALRIKEAAQMGFTRCVLPARNLPDESFPGIRLIGVNTLEEALERLSD